MIDLRSDTVTKPSPEMRRAMAEAEVGDDVYIEDPTIERLQKRAAEIFGREAALFLPSGTMGNLIAIKIHTHHGNEVICDERGHIFNYEMGSMAFIGGVMARPISTPDGILHWDMIQPAIRPKIYYRAQTALISLENTHNLAGGTVYPQEVSDEICDRAHDAGIAVHLDGARIFNAAVYLKKPVAEITAKFDSVQFCVSKGLGAPVGSLLVGSRDFIERARIYRKTFGGGMRQAGVLGAAALIALEKGPARLEEDHRNARHLAEGLARIPGVKVDLATVHTNIIVFDVAGTGFTAEELSKRLAAEGLLTNVFGPTIIRMVTHLDVDRPMIDKALDVFAKVAAGEALAAR